MLVIVKIIGLAMIAWGVVFIMKPDTYRKFLTFWENRKRIYLGAGIKIAAGAIFLYSATQGRVVWVLTVMGVLSLISGIVVLTMSSSKVQSFIKFWVDRPAIVVKMYGVAAILMGLIILYSA